MEHSMQRNIHALELDKILQMLAEEVSCEDAKKLALRLEPVSYTHLDVYKRQEYICCQISAAVLYYYLLMLMV